MDDAIQTNPFTIERAEYLRTMYRYNLWPKFATLVIFTALLIVCVGFLFGTPGVMGGSIAAVLALPLVLLARYHTSRRNIYDTASRQVFDDPRTMMFSGLGIHTKTEGGVESQVPWTHVVKAAQRGGFTLFFIGKTSHLIVPDSAFASPEAYEAFLILLKGQSFPKVFALTKP